MFNLLQIYIEPACGTSVCIAFDKLNLLSKLNLNYDDIIIIIVCGGSGINDEVLNYYKSLLINT